MSARTVVTALAFSMLYLCYLLLAAGRRLINGPLRRAWSLRQESVVVSTRWLVARVLRRIGRGQVRVIQRRLNPLRAPLGRLAKRVELSTINAGGVPALRVASRDGGADSALLYFHGGGYLLCSPTTHQNLMARLALATGSPIVGVDYRLGPQHPFPAAVDDALASYRWLTTQLAPQRIVVGGDSAGGGLALALMLALREAGEPLPAGAVLLSPWVDLTANDPSMAEHAHLDYLGGDPGRLEQIPRLYLGDADPHQPLASPINGDLRELPPLLIHAGGVEMLHDQVQRLDQRARAAGVQTTLEVWPNMVHVWHAFNTVFPRQAREAVDSVGRFVKQRLTTTDARSLQA